MTNIYSPVIIVFKLLFEHSNLSLICKNRENVIVKYYNLKMPNFVLLP